MSVMLKRMNGIPVEVKFWSFPGGERGVKVVGWMDMIDAGRVRIECLFKSSDDLMDILLLNDAVKRLNNLIDVELSIPYFPYARQDRVMTSGESMSLRVVAEVIKSCNFKNILVADPHSDVLQGMFGAELLIIPQESACEEILEVAGIEKDNTYLVSPDAGALKKIYKAAKMFNVPVIEARKVRDVATGEIVKTSVDKVEVDENPNFIILDDICDGGKTFIELAKEIRKVYGLCKIKLVVTHGIFSKGMEVLTAEIDEVYAAYLLDKQ